jgi:hypothetical protein
MKVAFRLTRNLLGEVINDLRRPHQFAAERVGFLSCRVGSLKPSGWIILAHAFYPVSDDDYLDDPSVGAMMGSAAIRKAMQIALNNDVGIFHVHMHEHRGSPRFSGTDLRETAKFVPDFWHVRPHMIHGAIVISLDSIAGLCWHPQRAAPICISAFSVVGAPMSLWRGQNDREI